MSETVRKIENKSLDNQKNPPETIKMPMLVLRGLVLFPEMVLHFDVPALSS